MKYNVTFFKSCHPERSRIQFLSLVILSAAGSVFKSCHPERSMIRRRDGSCEVEGPPCPLTHHNSPRLLALFQTRRRHRQRHLSLRRRQNKVSASKPLAITLGCVPYRSYFHFCVALGNLGWLTSLFVHVRLDHLGCGAGSQVSVLAFLQQRAHYNLRIAPWRHAHKPAVIFEIRLARSAHFRLQDVADGLRAASLSGEIDALQV